MKLQRKHIREEWDEGDDGYWIDLVPGWKWDDDTLGNCHIIHEDNKVSAYRQGVMPCNCNDCKAYKAGRCN